MDDPDVGGGGGGGGDPEFPGGCTGDPYWSDVVLLLRFDGADGSTTITDSSTFADHKTVSAGGQIISTTNPKHGTGSLKLLQPQPYGILWSGTRFSRASGTGFSIDFWYSGNSAGYSNAPTLFYLLDSGGNPVMRFAQGGLPAATMDFKVGADASVSLTRPIDVDGRTYFVVKWGTDDVLKVYGNDTLMYSISNPTNMLGSSNLYVAGDLSNTTGSHTAYMDTFRVTQADRPATVPTTVPCNGPTDINPISIPGTERLTGMGMTATAGDLNSPAGFRRLSGQAMATATGSVSVFNADRAVALTGHNLTAYRGTIASLPYPDLLSDTREFIFAPVWESVYLTVLNNGTFTISETDLSAAAYTGNWLAPTTMDVTTIASQYRGTAMTNYGAGTLDYTDLAPTALFSVSTTATSSVQKIHHFSITVVPTTTNPRYGEIGYQGVLRFRLALKLP